MKFPSLPRVDAPRLSLPRLGRPRLPWHRGVQTTELGAKSPLSAADQAVHDEDIRILRRTRIRLMAVSGAVTLVILAALGASIYWLVSSTIVNGDRSQLIQAATSVEPVGGDTEISLQGPGAGLFWVIILPGGTLQLPRGYSPTSLPQGLPYQPGLNAVQQSTSIDVRDVTLAGGGAYRILSGYSARLPGAKVQWIQNRAAEVSLLGTLQFVLLGGGAAALLLALLAGYLYAGRALVPIRASINRREAALQRQREFAANASHELRTPLTVIGASVEDLKRNRRSRVEDVGEALGDIDAEVRHMTALVEDLLLLARTDSGVVQVDRVPVDLGDIAVEAASMLTAVGDEKAVKVELDSLPALVMGDQLRLRQLVTILTDNAIKHTNQGSTVRVHIHPDTTVAIMRVDDQGPGVKPEDLPRIFERFWRADDAPAGGTGLGLSIAKWIVEQHGGAIGAYNRPEGGASFWVQLPLYNPAMPGVPEPAEMSGAAGDVAAEAPVGVAGGSAGVPTWMADDTAIESGSDRT